MADAHDDDLTSHERRNFLKLAGAGGFTAAVVAGGAGVLSSDTAVAQTRKEESDREAAAEHTMTIATAYALGSTRSYPVMQLDLKENIQNASNGRIYVKLAPGGQLGAGSAIVQLFWHGWRDPLPDKRTLISFEARDARAAHAGLVSLGIECQSDPVEFEDCLAFVLHDPDGNPIEIIQWKPSAEPYRVPEPRARELRARRD